ncbi:MAG: hypothetical protein KJN76_08840 [Eudoraea sp.]|nr:hypothetical protein [Eudoraea sp.]
MRVFSEEQRFNQWWVQLINVALIALLGYLTYHWYILKEGVDDPGNNYVLQLVVIGAIVLNLLIFYLIKLRTEIDESGVHYQFLPFQLSKKSIKWAEIEECYTREYNALKEYGGWGYRSKFGKGRAYNIKGNKGIQIVLISGQNILIGTQKMEQASEVIGRYKQKIK